ncbi:MAG: hypothetical protein U0I48_01245 [Acutalibacteraceae bacterium]|nr:hypothetical protein [Acutalibacteraceae bacterium]
MQYITSAVTILTLIGSLANAMKKTMVLLRLDVYQFVLVGL